MERFLCIHGHFYQPPRENPWLEAVEIQDTAHPYHDWNERITAECYSTNGASRILDNKGRILDIVSNYAKISFNIGPTLLSWLEKNATYTYDLILEADRLSQKMRSGHGSALAQAYNHMIMPLANSRDKKTQIVWGIRDFNYRFMRPPEGMWLPETAVDIETLDLMAAENVKFTILAPHQAKRVKIIGEKDWHDVPNATIDPSRAYLCRLPSGRTITLFFYDSPISHAVAFEGVLKSGEHFAKRLLHGYSDHRDGTQIVHIATDGESYGHHHRFGDMALAYALHYIENNELARITNYGEYLELHPPAHEVEIHENTSWSCAHGIERWRSDCGCTTGSHSGWNQQWRTPLRNALDWLRDELSSAFEQKAGEFFAAPWEARNDYINVILDRSDVNVDVFFNKHASKSLSRNQKNTAIKLLEMQRHAMLMFTSCGWFFEDISGIETVQVMQYAARAIQLAEDVFKQSYTEGFLNLLKNARSNFEKFGSGADIYNRFVKPSIVDLMKVSAHYAISSLYEDYPEKTRIYCYDIETDDYRSFHSGNTILVMGKSAVTSEITEDAQQINFSVLYLGGHDFNCGARPYVGDETYEIISDEMNSAFEGGAFADIVRLIDKHFGVHRYYLKDLFRDEQRKILETIITETMNGFENSYRSMYEDNRILMSFLQETGIPVIKAFLTAADYTLNLDLKRYLTTDFDPDSIRDTLEELKKWHISSDTVELEFAFRRALINKIKALHDDPANLDLLESIDASLDISQELPFNLNLWPLQNSYYILAKNDYPKFSAKARDNDNSAKQWAERFVSIGKKLNFNLDSILPGENG